MNHVNVEEVEAQPDAVIGKFLVKSFTTIVLFDTGASHSYISRGFVDKYKLPTKVLRTPMLVTSPGAEYMASSGCFQMPLTIGSHVFPSNLVILESQGLDVILGMDWLSMYGGNIDCASKSILLTTPEGKRIKYVSTHVPRRTQVNLARESCSGGSACCEGLPRCISRGVTRHAARSRHRVFDRIIARHRTNI